MARCGSGVVQTGQCLNVFTSEGPYAGNEHHRRYRHHRGQKAALKALGAIELLSREMPDQQARAFICAIYRPARAPDRPYAKLHGINPASPRRELELLTLLGQASRLKRSLRPCHFPKHRQETRNTFTPVGVRNSSAKRWPRPKNWASCRPCNCL